VVAVAVLDDGACVAVDVLEEEVSDVIVLCFAELVTPGSVALHSPVPVSPCVEACSPQQASNAPVSTSHVR
jgi:hypothetical protein